MKASHLELSFGAKKVYDDCSFNFEAQDKVGIVGVNGAGKTTLFRIIQAETKDDAGSIELASII